MSTKPRPRGRVDHPLREPGPVDFRQSVSRAVSSRATDHVAVSQSPSELEQEAVGKTGPVERMHPFSCFTIPFAEPDSIPGLQVSAHEREMDAEAEQQIL